MAAVATVLALGLAAPAAKAQMFYEPVRIGIKGGATYSTVTSDGRVDDPNYTWGFLGGLVLSAKFNENIGIQPELLWNRKGYNNDFDIAGNRYDAEVRLDYLQLPVLFTAQAGPVQFQVGPYVSYLVNADFEVENTATNTDQTYDLNKDDFNEWDFGLTGGVAVDFNPIQVGVRADWGFSNIADVNNDQRLNARSDNQNISFNVYAAFMFGN